MAEKSITLTENRFVLFSPSIKLGSYLSLFAGILLLVVGIIFNYFLIIMLGVLFIIMFLPLLWKIFKTYKQKPKRLQIVLNNSNLTFKYESFEKSVPVNNLHKVIFIIDKDKLKAKKIVYCIITRFGKTEKKLLDNLVPGIFTRENANKIQSFFAQNLPQVKVSIFTVDEIA